MIIINFSSTPKQAFTQGFLKGLSAPVMLFGNYTAPPLPEITSISLPPVPPDQALANDWKKIGVDFNNVIIAYGKATETSNPTDA